MQSDRFRPLLASRGPYGSVYFDDSHDTADAAAQLDIKWRHLRTQLEEQGADPAITDRLEAAIRRSDPAVGKSGRAVVAGPDGVMLNEHLIGPTPAPVVRVSNLPYIVPVVEHGLEDPAYLVVAVDHTGGDLALHHYGRMRKETVDGGGYPVHKAHRAETPGFGDPQPRTEEARRKNVQAVADRVTALVDDSGPEVVFVVGEVQSRNDFIDSVPERVADRAVELGVGARTSIDDDALREAISTEFQLRRRNVIDDAAERFQAELGRGSGLATEGLAGVTAALRAAAVDTLIIGDMGDVTVVAGDELATVSPNADVLSQLGEPPTQVLRADEALPMVAVSIGAKLVPAEDRVTPTEGVGALLRFPVG
ncbi:MAG: hypothetical protein ACRDU5_07825 [Mycobacterium sp.]